MPSARSTLAAAASAAVASASTLSGICTTTYAASKLPASDFFPGITIDSSSVSTALVTDTTVSSDFYDEATVSYCNVTFAYSHDGADDMVHVAYMLPAPSEFQGRYMSTGGGGLAINSGGSFTPAGTLVGAVAGITDGGFGSFDTEWDAVFLKANNSINWDAVYNFGYQSHHELAVLGKEYTKSLYNASKVYSYYLGCSEGGREGWSQVQRFEDQFDGAVIGAPALRYGQQQVNHLSSPVIDQELGYYPPPCELEKIMNLTIAYCDPLDGKTDGVIARSDLCKLKFDLNSTIGEPYYCAQSQSMGFGKRDTVPAQNGTVTAKAAAVFQTVLDGIKDSDGKQIYFTFQIGADNSEAAGEYDATTGEYGVQINSLGGEWVARFLLLQDADTLTNLNNVTGDTIREWMTLGMDRYYDSLQTTNPDLTAFAQAGGKVIHIHGEQDNSIPTASSVRYRESVRSIMYPDLTFNESSSKLDEFYRLYLVPGAAHCGANSYQANGGWPKTTVQTMIQWVEEGIAPNTLNNSGVGINELCRWPLRPLWSGNGTSFDCVYDQASIDSWIYDLDAFKVPVY